MIVYLNVVVEKYNGLYFEESPLRPEGIKFYRLTDEGVEAYTNLTKAFRNLN